MDGLIWPRPDEWPRMESDDYLPFVSQWLEKNNLYMSAAPRGTNMCKERSLKGKLPLRWYQLGDRVVYGGGKPETVVIDSVEEDGGYMIAGKKVDPETVKPVKGSNTSKGIVRSYNADKTISVLYDARGVKMYYPGEWGFEDGTCVRYKGNEVLVTKIDASRYDIEGTITTRGHLEPIVDRSIIEFREGEKNLKGRYRGESVKESIVVIQEGKKKGRTELEWELLPGPASLTTQKSVGIVHGALGDYITLADGTVIPDNGMHLKVRGRFSPAGELTRTTTKALQKIRVTVDDDEEPKSIVKGKRGVYIRVAGKNIVIPLSTTHDYNISPVDDGEEVRGRAASTLAETFTAAKTPENYQKLIPYLLHPNAVIGRNEDHRFNDSDKLAGLLVIHPTGSGKTITIVGVINVWVEHNFKIAIEELRRKGGRMPDTFEKLWNIGKEHSEFKKIIVITPDKELVDNAKRELVATRGFVCRLMRQSGNERATIRKMIEGEPLDPCKEELDFDTRSGRGAVRKERLSHFISFFHSYVTAGNICPFHVVDDDVRSVSTDDSDDQEDDIEHFESFGDAISDRRMRGNRMTNHPFTPPEVKEDDELFSMYNPFDNAVVLMDEFHNAVNTSVIDSSRIAWKKSLPRLAETLRVSTGSVVVGLTATPIVGTVEDLKRGVRILRGKFSGNFIDSNGNITPEAFRKMKGYISFYDIEKDHHLFPSMKPRKKENEMFQPPCYVVRPLSKILQDNYKDKNKAKPHFEPNFEKTMASKQVALRQYKVGERCLVKKFPTSERWFESKIKESGADGLLVKICYTYMHLWTKERAGDILGDDDEDIIRCGAGSFRNSAVVEISDPRNIRRMKGVDTLLKPSDNPSMLGQYMTTVATLSNGAESEMSGERLKDDKIDDYPKLKAVVENIVQFCESGQPGKLIVFSDHNAPDLATIANALRTRNIEEWDRKKPEDKRNRFVLLGNNKGEGKEERLEFEYSKRYFLEGKMNRERVGEENADGSYVKVALLRTRKYYQGVDFKNIREVHIVGVPPDIRTYQQMIGRARRNCSHKTLPKKDWTVKVFLYISSFVGEYDSCTTRKKSKPEEGAAPQSDTESKGVVDDDSPRSTGSDRYSFRHGVKKVDRFEVNFDDDAGAAGGGDVFKGDGDGDVDEIAQKGNIHPLLTVDLDFRDENEKKIPDQTLRLKVHKKKAAEAKKYALLVCARPYVDSPTNTVYWVTADQAAWLLAIKNYIGPSKVLESLKRVSVDCKANAIRTGIPMTSCGGIGYDPCEDLANSSEYYNIIDKAVRHHRGDMEQIIQYVVNRLSKIGCDDVDRDHIRQYAREYSAQYKKAPDEKYAKQIKKLYRIPKYHRDSGRKDKRAVCPTAQRPSVTTGKCPPLFPIKGYTSMKAQCCYRKKGFGGTSPQSFIRHRVRKSDTRFFPGERAIQPLKYGKVPPTALEYIDYLTRKKDVERRMIRTSGPYIDRPLIAKRRLEKFRKKYPFGTDFKATAEQESDSLKRKINKMIKKRGGTPIKWDDCPRKRKPPCDPASEYPTLNSEGDCCGKSDAEKKAIEAAKAAEKAKKEAARAAEKAKKEAARAEEKAKKEAARAEEKAKKEAARAEEKAKKEAARAEEKAKKEAARAEEKAKKEAARAEEKAKKDAARAEEKAKKDAARAEERKRATDLDPNTTTRKKCKKGRDVPPSGKCVDPFPKLGKSGCCEKKRGGIMKKKESVPSPHPIAFIPSPRAGVPVSPHPAVLIPPPPVVTGSPKIRTCRKGREVPPDGICKSPFPIKRFKHGVACCEKKRGGIMKKRESVPSPHPVVLSPPPRGTTPTHGSPPSPRAVEVPVSPHPVVLIPLPPVITGSPTVDMQMRVIQKTPFVTP